MPEIIPFLDYLNLKATLRAGVEEITQGQAQTGVILEEALGYTPRLSR